MAISLSVTVSIGELTQRNIQPNVPRQLRANIHLRRHHFAIPRHEQHIVKRNGLLDEFGFGNR